MKKNKNTKGLFYLFAILFLFSCSEQEKIKNNKDEFQEFSNQFDNYLENTQYAYKEVFQSEKKVKEQIDKYFISTNKPLSNKTLIITKKRATVAPKQTGIEGQTTTNYVSEQNILYLPEYFNKFHSDLLKNFYQEMINANDSEVEEIIYKYIGELNNDKLLPSAEKEEVNFLLDSALKTFYTFSNVNYVQNSKIARANSVILPSDDNPDDNPDDISGSFGNCMRKTAGKKIGRGIAGGAIAGAVFGGPIGMAKGAVGGAVFGAFWVAADCAHLIHIRLVYLTPDDLLDLDSDSDLELSSDLFSPNEIIIKD